MKTRILVSVLCLSSVLAGSTPGQVTDHVARLESKLETTMDELNKRDSIELMGNLVRLDKVPLEPVQSTEKSEDPLVAKIEHFFRSRKIHVEFPNDESAADYFGRALGEQKIDIELKGLTHGASEGL